MQQTQSAARAIEEAAREVERGCSFDAFQRRMAVLEPLGTALVILAFSAMHFGALATVSFGADGTVVGSFLDKLLSILTKEFVETDYAQAHVVSMALFFAFLVAALFVQRKAKEEASAFRAAHPYIGKRSDPARIAAARIHGKRFALAGVALLGCAFAVHLATLGLEPQAAHNVDALFIDSGSAAYEVSDGVVLALVGLGVGLVMHGDRAAASPSYELYNLRTLARRSVYDVEQTANKRLKPVLLVMKRSLSRCITAAHAVAAVCVFASVCMFFLPSLETPLWWVPLVIGFFLRDAIESANVVRLHRRYGPLLAELSTPA